ncbi:O-antigen ligase family protein [Microvirga roseola]|uniref:O-antigen ligase family protein n=1 Tax=Microvirga roseola TaxID=2883126 RepID=UPI001E5FAA5C|nr:O-antigen ligase family protein [Microvirga roseola]
MRTCDAATSGPSLPASRLRLADGLRRAAMGALALMPVGMAIASRSSPVFIVAGALFSLGAVAAEGKLRPLARTAASALASPLGLAALAFLAWCLVSIGWSEFKATSLDAFGEFVLPLAAAFVLALTLARRVTRAAFWLLAGALVAACLSITFELRTGLAWRQALGVNAYSFIFNRPVLALVVLTPPLVAWLICHVRHGWICSLGLVLLLTGVALSSDSNAALLGLAVALLVFCLAWAAPRLAALLVAAGLVLSAAGAPLVGPLTSYLPASFHERMAEGHSRERVELWNSFGAVVQEQPLLGGGFGISPRMHRTAIARQVPSDRQTMLAIGHPHNAALQIWAELGAVGVVLALAVLLLVLRNVVRLPEPVRSAALALIAGAAAVAFVGHGAWQGWWAAALGSATIWMIAAGNRPETRS